MSSRNQYLSQTERQQAAILYRGLTAAKTAFNQGLRSQPSLIQSVREVLVQAPAVTPEYVELVHPNTLDPLETVKTIGMIAIAAQVGTTRLIDNIVLRDRQPVIAIDGPAGAGKSTVARQLAHQLDLLYLDTGAMYRALTWFVLNQGISTQDELAVAELLPQCNIQLTAPKINAEQSLLPPDVWVNGENVTQAIRNAEVTAQVSTIAAQFAVRQSLVDLQQQYGLKGGIVADGRDTGTHVFPEAELKIFLTASVQERARRRQQDLISQSLSVPDLIELETSISERDYKDSNRAISPLRKAENAIEIVTDNMSVDEVIEQIANLYEDSISR